MHTLPVLHKFFADAFPEIHATRLEALTVAVDSVCQGARVSITAMGRGLDSPVRIKHRVKRMNRLVGNDSLSAERETFYRAMNRRLLIGTHEPIVLVDWSEFTPEGAQQLLRASLLVGGRAITLYEELHPQALLGNRAVQHRFLDKLQTLLPSKCKPIVIADAGFRVPFFRHVERLGWHWLGRIRNRDYSATITLTGALPHLKGYRRTAVASYNSLPETVGGGGIYGEENRDSDAARSDQGVASALSRWVQAGEGTDPRSVGRGERLPSQDGGADTQRWHKGPGSGAPTA